jgi:hypothetical protein
MLTQPKMDKRGAKKAQADERIQRLRGIYGAANNAALARELGVKKMTVSSWRKRGVPDSVCVQVAKDKGVSLDWLLYGIEAASAAADEKGSYNTNRGAGAMNRDEQRDWVAALDQLSPEARARLRAVVDSLASAARTKKPTG